MTDLQDELIIEKALRRDAVVRVRELTAERDELKAKMEADYADAKSKPDDLA